MTLLSRAWPHLLLASLCLGLASANVARPGWPAALAAVAVAGLAVVVRRSAWRLALLGVALLAAGWGWGSARLEAIDASPLSAQVGETAVARVV
ncbi:MAG: hypothetical protein C4306_08075, partial [Thermoleophilia bacterium]